MSEENFEVKVNHCFSRERIDCLLVGAFEGGSNYWIKSVNRVDRTEDFYEVAPYSRGLCVVNDEGQSNYVTLTTIRRGLQVMADKYPRHMADFIASNDDATTADVFLQCCLFGEVVYG